MNTAKLQAFAQDARRQLMNAVSAQLDATLAENSRARTDEPGAVRFLEKRLRMKPGNPAVGMLLGRLLLSNTLTAGSTESLRCVIWMCMVSPTFT